MEFRSHEPQVVLLHAHRLSLPGAVQHQQDGQLLLDGGGVLGGLAQVPAGADDVEVLAAFDFEFTCHAVVHDGGDAEPLPGGAGHPAAEERILLEALLDLVVEAGLGHIPAAAEKLVIRAVP